jgi:hypothetical protein
MQSTSLAARLSHLMEAGITVTVHFIQFTVWPWRDDASESATRQFSALSP